MFANVMLYTDPQPDAIVVPSESIVRSGSREQVFVVRAPGKFEPREVTLGVSAEGFTQILSGLQAGERVVTSSQFLIDSESKLREATAKMMEAMAAGDNMDMEEMSMEDMSMDDMSMDDMSMGGMSMDDMDMSDMNMDEMNAEESQHDH
jgi:Cu(I)/Ag(I) efflux system membrane fusion protein